MPVKKKFPKLNERIKGIFICRKRNILNCERHFPDCPITGNSNICKKCPFGKKKY